jgi:phosphopantothenate synthetase
MEKKLCSGIYTCKVVLLVLESGFWVRSMARSDRAVVAVPIFGGRVIISNECL